MTDDPVEKMASDVTNAMMGRPMLSNMDDDETVTVRLNWFNHPRTDSEWFSIGAVFGVRTEVWREYLEENVEPDVDKRTVGKEGTVQIGTLTFRGDGTVVGHELNDEYKKPTKR